MIISESRNTTETAKRKDNDALPVDDAVYKILEKQRADVGRGVDKHGGEYGARHIHNEHEKQSGEEVDRRSHEAEMGHREEKGGEERRGFNAAAFVFRRDDAAEEKFLEYGGDKRKGENRVDSAGHSFRQRGRVGNGGSGIIASDKARHPVIDERTA